MTNKISGQQPFLEKLGISSLNPMQISANESIQQNNKVILLSNTGSGKTIAFLTSLLGSLKTDISYTQALIVVPSRELALQIEDVLKKMQTGFKITACYGGHKREIEENNLVEPPTILVATPGRLGDHIRRKNVDLSKVHFLVLDEFDKCLELGFQEEIEFVIQSLPAIEKRMLISATYASVIPDFVEMSDAATVNFLAPEANKSEKLSIRVVHTPENDKLDSLLKLVCFVRNTSTIIFCNHRDAVERTSNLHNQLVTLGYTGVLDMGGILNWPYEVVKE